VLEHIPWPDAHYAEANFTRTNDVWQREFGIPIQEVRVCVCVRARCVRARARERVCVCVLCASCDRSHMHAQRIRKRARDRGQTRAPARAQVLMMTSMASDGNRACATHLFFSIFCLCFLGPRAKGQLVLLARV
jgi:hypothetical protein